ncbi:MAG: phosphoribosylaminoimidazolesuccinocarboxamide synthase [Candidatus Marinimicrobia bacterium]|nr:phosphoribosylaminoimidazolesuccinocarboxamide synthase [Candidatus Neomarinimicrobiota bacterium]
MNAIELNNQYNSRIKAGLNNTLTKTDLPDISSANRRTGKIRDQYNLGDKIALITTDRQSAFDRVLASIPFKGQVLNLTSAWWFEQTKHIVPNHVISVPDPNVTLAKKCEVFLIEFVVRGYITGSTNTSLWTVYNKGDREYCGNVLPGGLVKNQKLETNMLTPTTKEEYHDRPISPDEIVHERWMTQKDWEYCSQKALELFAFGQKKAAEHGLVLVDTKYEMGRDVDGNIVLIDEIHTPDSSRYWIAKTYDERMAAGQEPQNIDKEFLRLWFVNNCDPYNDETLPDAPEELVTELSSRYIYLYETITGGLFPFPDSSKSVQERINENLKGII